MRRAVGIREAKSELSRLLREVQEGGVEWVITDRGRPVARLVPVTPEHLSPDEQLAQLERWGWIERPAGGPHPLPTPVAVPGEIAQRILQQHRDA